MEGKMNITVITAYDTKDGHTQVVYVYEGRGMERAIRKDLGIFDDVEGIALRLEGDQQVEVGTTILRRHILSVA
jgi:hypothetical protein